MNNKGFNMKYDVEVDFEVHMLLCYIEDTVRQEYRIGVIKAVANLAPSIWGQDEQEEVQCIRLLSRGIKRQ